MKKCVVFDFEGALYTTNQAQKETILRALYKLCKKENVNVVVSAESSHDAVVKYLGNVSTKLLLISSKCGTLIKDREGYIVYDAPPRDLSFTPDMLADIMQHHHANCYRYKTPWDASVNLSFLHPLIVKYRILGNQDQRVAHYKAYDEQLMDRYMLCGLLTKKYSHIQAVVSADDGVLIIPKGIGKGSIAEVLSTYYGAEMSYYIFGDRFHPYHTDDALFRKFKDFFLPTVHIQCHSAKNTTQMIERLFLC